MQSYCESDTCILRQYSLVTYIRTYACILSVALLSCFLHNQWGPNMELMEHVTQHGTLSCNLPHQSTSISLPYVSMSGQVDPLTINFNPLSNIHVHVYSVNAIDVECGLGLKILCTPHHTVWCVQLQLPEQTEKVQWLTFSLVEAFFYKKQQKKCKSEATQVWIAFYRLSSLL